MRIILFTQIVKEEAPSVTNSKHDLLYSGGYKQKISYSKFP